MRKYKENEYKEKDISDRKMDFEVLNMDEYSIWMERTKYVK